jgi:hypothetical protein
MPEKNGSTFEAEHERGEHTEYVEGCPLCEEDARDTDELMSYDEIDDG